METTFKRLADDRSMTFAQRYLPQFAGCQVYGVQRSLEAYHAGQGGSSLAKAAATEGSRQGVGPSGKSNFRVLPTRKQMRKR